MGAHEKRKKRAVLQIRWYLCWRLSRNYPVEKARLKIPTMRQHVVWSMERSYTEAEVWPVLLMIMEGAFKQCFIFF